MWSTPGRRSETERHLSGTPVGRLQFLGRRQSRVGVKIDGDIARSREGQKMLWGTCNLLCRLKGVVSQIEVCIPSGTDVAEPNMVRRGQWSGRLSDSLRGALDARARECAVFVEQGDLEGEADITVLLGHGTRTRSRSPVEICAACDGWIADCWYGENAPSGLRAADSGNPFGAAAAACIAAGEVFKHAGGMECDGEWPWRSTRFSMYDLRRHGVRSAAPANPPLPDQVDVGSLAVFGCGAVGHAFCQCLDMISGISADLSLVDQSLNGMQGNEMIDDTNLARYVMCTNADLGNPKAGALAAAMRGRSGVDISHTDGGIDEIRGNAWTSDLKNAVSCVDNNPARHEIQDLRLSRVHGGSAFEIQSQVSVYDAAKGTQCLKCNNPLDDAYSAGATTREEGGRVRTRAASAVRGQPLPQAAPGAILRGGGCGTLDYDSRPRIPLLADADFSVNFVTAFSGAVMAAEVVKYSCSSMAPALDCGPNTDMFYSFWNGKPHLTMTGPRAECCGRLLPAQVRPRRIQAAV